MPQLLPARAHAACGNVPALGHCAAVLRRSRRSDDHSNGICRIAAAMPDLPSL